jgi:hypothetical protein
MNDHEPNNSTPTTPCTASEPVAPSDAPSDVPPPQMGNTDVEAAGALNKLGKPKGGRPPGSKSKSPLGRFRSNLIWAAAQLTRKELLEMARDRKQRAHFARLVRYAMPVPKPTQGADNASAAVKVVYVDEPSVRMGQLHGDLDDTPPQTGRTGTDAPSAPAPDVSEPNPDAPLPVPSKLTAADILKVANDRDNPDAKALRALIQSAALDQGVRLSDLEAKYAERRRQAMEAEHRARQARMFADDSCWRGSDNNPFDNDLPRQF